MIKDEHRRHLKMKGWKRQDRISQGEHVEYWADPTTFKVGYVKTYSLQHAIRLQKGRDTEEEHQRIKAKHGCVGWICSQCDSVCYPR